MNKPRQTGSHSFHVGSESRTLSADFVLSSQIHETRLSLLPKTLEILSESAERRASLPIVCPHHQKARDSMAQWIAAAYRSDVTRQVLLDEIDHVTRVEADRILAFTQKQEIEMRTSKVWDVFIVGAGWGGVVTAAKLNTLLPDVETIMVDENPLRGGTFRDGGYDYRFNSPTSGKNSGLPGELDGPNYLGPDVLVQIGDLTDDLYPLKSTAGETFAIDGFDAGPAIPEAKVTEVHITGNPQRPYRIKLLDKRSGTTYHFYTRVVVLATGQGKAAWGFNIDQPETNATLEKQSERIFLNDEFRNYLHLQNAQAILRMVQDGLAFGGGRDGTNTTVRYIISRLREICSDDEIKQLSIDVYGTHYVSADDFSEVMGTNVYDDLIPFIGNLMVPKEEKITGLFDAADAVGLKLENNESAHVGTFCASAGYTDEQLQNLLRNISGHSEPVMLDEVLGEGELAEQIIARSVKDEDIFVVGVAARVKKPPRTGKSLRTFGRAIRKHAPRVLEASDVIADALQKQKSSAEDPAYYEYESVH